MRGWLRRLRALVVRTTAALILGSVLIVVAFRWIDPPTSSVMLREHVSRLTAGEAAPLRHRWVDWDAISSAVPIAVVAGEDQRFPEHHGFDLRQIRDAVAGRQHRGHLRGASTITQQVAKNLFLWSGRSWLRKALEAYFTVLIELSWPKQRILELYLNVAQFGDDVFGIGAASEAFFGKPAARLTAREAALLAAVLPNPEVRRPDRPSPSVSARAAWIQKQVGQLGGAAYLGRADE